MRSVLKKSVRLPRIASRCLLWQLSSPRELRSVDTERLVRKGVERWCEAHEYESIDQVRDGMSLATSQIRVRPTAGIIYRSFNHGSAVCSLL
jgi:hypothetical protein